MSASDFVHVSSTQFGDILYFTVSSPSGEELVWTGLYDRPRKFKLIPKAQLTDPAMALFVVEADCGKGGATEVEESRGQVVKPGAKVQLLHGLHQQYVSWTDNVSVRELAFAKQKEISLSFSVYSKRPVIGAGILINDEIAIHGECGGIALKLGNDFWFKGDTYEKWTVHRFEEYAKEASEVRYSEAYKLRSNNGMYLSVLPIFANSATLVLPEENQSPDCFADPDTQCFPEYIGPLRADLTTDSEDANNCWVMERDDPFVGGLLRSEDKFVMRHVASGRYLTSDLSLVAKAQAKKFVFISVDGAGTIGFGEDVDLASEGGGVVSIDVSPNADSLQSQLFQKVASDLPRDGVMRKALVGEEKSSTVDSLKFEVQHLSKSNSSDLKFLAAYGKSVVRCKIALQNIKKLANAEEILTQIDREFCESFLRMGEKYCVQQANIASDMQIVAELFRIYLLKTYYSSDFKALFDKLTMFSSNYVFYSGQYHDRPYYALMARKSMLSAWIALMPIEATDLLGFGLIRTTPTTYMRQYWAEFCMGLKTANKDAESYGEIWFFLQRLLIGLKFSLPPSGLHVIKYEEKFYAEFLPDGLFRFKSDTKPINEQPDRILYFTRHLMSVVRYMCTDPEARQEIVAGIGLDLPNVIQYYTKYQNLPRFIYVMMSFFSLVYVGEESRRPPISKYMKTHALCLTELTEVQTIDQNNLFFFVNSDSLLASLVKDEVYFWLSTVHDLTAEPIYWYGIASSHISFATELIEHDSVSDAFVAAVVAATSAMIRWVLGEKIEGLSERFPDLSKTQYLKTNTTQMCIDGYLQLVSTVHQWKKMKVLRKLAAVGKNNVTREELQTAIKELDFSNIVEKYSAQFAAPRSQSVKGEALVSAGANSESPLLNTLKKLMDNPLVRLEGVLYHIFTTPELRPKAMFHLLLKMVDDEIDMSASLAAFLQESFSEEPFREYLPLVENVKKHTISLLELETLPGESVKGLSDLVADMRNLAVFMLRLIDNPEANRNFQQFLNKLEFVKSLEDFWQWSLAIGTAFSSEPLSTQLRTLTIELTRLYIRGSIANRKEVLNILPVQAFYPDFPQYIQLLKELDLMDESGSLAVSLANLAYQSAGNSKRAVYALKELMINPNARSKILFSILERMLKIERKVLSENEWEIVVLLAKQLNMKDRVKWMKPIIEKWHSGSIEGIRKNIAAMYILASEATSEIFLKSAKTFENCLKRINSENIENLAALFKNAEALQQGKYTVLEEGLDEEAVFLLDNLCEKDDGLLSVISSELKKAEFQTITRELAKLFLTIAKDPNLQRFSTLLSATLRTYYETPNLELGEEDKGLSAEVLTVPAPTDPGSHTSIVVPLPAPVILVSGEFHYLRPSLQKLFLEEKTTAETYRIQGGIVKKTKSLKTITCSSFDDIEKWFPMKDFEVEYLQACEKAANLIVPELLKGKEDTLIPVIQTLLDLAIHRGSDEVTKDVLGIILGIVKSFDEVRSHFLALLKKRRYYLQVFALFSDLVNNHKDLSAKIAGKERNLQSIFWEEDYAKNTDAIVVFLSLFQYCCDGCNTAFQEFLRDQQEGAQNNINVVALATGLLTEVMIDMSKPLERRIMEACCLMLLETVSGPSSGNQKTVCGYPKFLDNVKNLINSLVGKAAVKPEVREQMPGILRLILTLLEGRERNPKAIEEVMDSIDFELFKTLALKEAIQFDDATLRAISLGTRTEQQKSAFDFTILCFLVCFNTLSDDDLAEFKLQPITKFISSVEIEAEDPITREPTIRFLSFPVSSICHYLTGETSLRLLFDINRESRQVKLDDFTNKIDVCQTEMQHQQTISRMRCLKAVTRWWKFYWYFSFFVLILINVLLLLIVESQGDTRFHIPENWLRVIVPLGVIQLASSVLGTFSFYVEYSYTFRKALNSREETTEIKNLLKVDCPGSSLSVYLATRKEGGKSTFKMDQLLMAGIRVGFSAGAVAAFWLPFLYPFLLFQIVNLNDSVVNILKSVTQRGSQLALTLLFALISMYAFTLVAYFFFYSYYSEEAGMFCNTLAECFLSTVNLGMRSGGGIGDAFGPADPTNYEFRILFDLLFYICITTVLMAIVFGLIVDTFSELRDERNSIEFDMNNVCLICGNTRSVIELKGEGWQNHTMFVHNPFAYLYFLIHINETDINDCSGIEKIVKEKLVAKDISFYPTTSRELGFSVVVSE